MLTRAQVEVARLRQCSNVGRPRGIKKFAVNTLRSATQVRLNRFVIYGRSRGSFVDKAAPSKAVLLQCSPPGVARRTAIALMLGWDESSIFVNWFWCGIVTVGTFYPGLFDSNWWREVKLLVSPLGAFQAGLIYNTLWGTLANCLLRSLQLILGSERCPRPDKVRPQHRGLRILSGFFNVPYFLISNKDYETGPPVYSPYPRRLERLTNCRCNYKDISFSSVILRPWVLVRPESNSRPPAWQPDAQPTEPPVRGSIRELDLKQRQRRRQRKHHLKT